MKTFHSRTKIRLHAAARKLIRSGPLSIGFGLLVLPILFFLFDESVWEFREHSPERGAASSKQDLFNDVYGSTKYLDQGWTQNESAWFYSVNQGSDLLPYDFFLSLTSAGREELFRSDANIKRWRYLPQVATSHNPDALPVGFAEDNYDGRKYVGLTCAACHTGQIDYHGVAIRIDGGPAMADMQTFLRELIDAVKEAAQVDASGKCAADTCRRFVARVLALGSYKNEREITRDLRKTLLRLTLDNLSNNHRGAHEKCDAETPVPYGYARLDAFGRIYNRVLDGVIQKSDLVETLPDIFGTNELPAVQAALKPVLDPNAPEGKELGEDDRHLTVLERALPLLTKEQQATLVAGLFNSSTAPVSYPFLWDTPQHDYVQWNGIVPNSSFGPIGRNAGEVIGVFGTMDWTIKKGFSLSSWLGGQGFRRQHISYESSVYVHNLRRVEAQLVKLWSPLWPEEILGKLDWGHAYNGKVLFKRHCANCHEEIDRASADRRIVASMTKLSNIGTDSFMANNSVNDTGYAGMVRNQYVGFPVGSVLLNRRAPVAALLTQVTHGVIAEPYPNANAFRRVADWLSDLSLSFIDNDIKASIKEGNYNVDTTASPFASLGAYKGRSLNGIWATAPYLHNGSVPTLYDLLLPKRQAGDPDGEEYRPDRFVVGSREFDPDRVGFVSRANEGSEFDVTLCGNDNSGHEYGTIHDERVRSGELKAMTKEERNDLLQYLKTR